MAEFCKITGELPQTLFSLPNLQTVKLRNNRLNGTLNLGSSYSSQLHLVDVQNNDIQNYKDVQGFNGTIMLMGNSFCQQPGSNAIYCSLPQQNIPYSTGTSNCVPILCPSDQNLSPNCLCAYPYAGTIYFRAPSFSSLGNVSYYSTLEHDILDKFQNHSLPIDSVALSNPHMDDNNYLEVSLQVFPSGKIRFGYSEISDMGFLLSNQTYKPPPGYGPYVFRAVEYAAFPVSTSPSSSSKSTNVPVIIGASVGGFVVATLIVCVLVYAIWQKRKIKRVRERSQPFASWDSGKSSGSVSVPQLKGPRSFTYDELKHSTNNFSEANDIGSGGYGKVYRGMLYTGQLIAIKRAQQGSMQGGLEFKTEIELLSRVHHKHLVSLVGFCFDQGEQLLVYEYVPNGSLKDSLTGKSGIRLDWKRRLRIALGTAKGLTYLHELANPPIVHRDIKSNNILLDDHLNAKVADFGLSKPMGPNQKGHMTTQVKGTMGYLDPEYYMTQQLTEKSDVYSFGVLLLELITARRPIDKGRYIVREVKVTMDRTKDLYNLHELLDPAIVLGTSLGGFGKFVDLALRCVEESGVDRPAMSEVVKEIENIMQLAGMNPNADSATPSASYDGGSRASRHPYGNEANFDYSGGPPSSKVEPK
ncbi:putative leucine-rich repeat receptor-like protein kinase [Acorus gramineus]|uniref:non-specific serine/threonine protein kinase n=1 Tax=Acorus gramineus TaxID=55184 RepID=A0AAV9AGW0_ACOGR|nr:putative leucine-rich repeat receptor-like protein kinase [Acorus gramineus]